MNLSNVKDKYGDKWLWGILIALLFYSVVEVYSASSTLAYKTHFWKPILGHLTYLSAMLLCAVGIVKYGTRRTISYLSYWVFPLAIFLLIYGFFFGKELNEAKRWVEVPIIHLSFQPSEFFKAGLIFFSARMLRTHHLETLIKNYWKLFLYSAVPLFLVFRENFSTFAILTFYLAAMLYVNIGFKKKFFFSKQILIVGGILVAFVGVFFLLPAQTQQKVIPRFGTWVNRTSQDVDAKEDTLSSDRFVINDKNSQEQYAKMAIGRGGFLGKFPGNSKARDLLPQAFSDFIYAIVIEELGFVLGGLMLPAIYLLLFFRLGYWAKRTDNAYYRNILMGFSIMYLLQATMNFAVSVGFIPVTGQTLPFVSRGGTSLLVTGAMFAVLIAITKIIMEQEREQTSTEDSELEVFSSLETTHQ